MGSVFEKRTALPVSRFVREIRSTLSRATALPSAFATSRRSERAIPGCCIALKSAFAAPAGASKDMPKLTERGGSGEAEGEAPALSEAVGEGEGLLEGVCVGVTDDVPEGVMEGVGVTEAVAIELALASALALAGAVAAALALAETLAEPVAEASALAEGEPDVLCEGEGEPLLVSVAPCEGSEGQDVAVAAADAVSETVPLTVPLALSVAATEALPLCVTVTLVVPLTVIVGERVVVTLAVPVGERVIVTLGVPVPEPPEGERECVGETVLLTEIEGLSDVVALAPDGEAVALEEDDVVAATKPVGQADAVERKLGERLPDGVPEPLRETVPVALREPVRVTVTEVVRVTLTETERVRETEFVCVTETVCVADGLPEVEGEGVGCARAAVSTAARQRMNRAPPVRGRCAAARAMGMDASAGGERCAHTAKERRNGRGRAARQANVARASPPFGRQDAQVKTSSARNATG
jgi:hypothetical protein